MPSKKLVLLSLLVVLVIGVSSDAHNQDLPHLPCRELQDGLDLVVLDNATMEEDILSTCLIVGYTWYGGSTSAEEETLWPYVMLRLSMDNSSWLRLDSCTHSFDTHENHSRFFRIYNSLVQPFPFDVEPGEILYVSILYSTGPIDLIESGFNFNQRTPSIGVVVSSGIKRYWYFTIDWRIPGIFGYVLMWIGTVFLMSRPIKDT